MSQRSELTTDSLRREHFAGSLDDVVDPVVLEYYIWLGGLIGVQLDSFALQLLSNVRQAPARLWFWCFLAIDSRCFAALSALPSDILSRRVAIDSEGKLHWRRDCFGSRLSLEMPQLPRVMTKPLLGAPSPTLPTGSVHVWTSGNPWHSSGMREYGQADLH